MKRVLILVAILAAGFAPCRAQQPSVRQAEFRTFYANFLAAVSANDKEKLADLIAFPVKDWSVERKGNIRTETIKDRGDFLSRYGTLFTAPMRSNIPRVKPQKVTDDHYALIWQEANSEFSLEFEYIAGSGFRVTAYDIGPR